MAEAEFGNALKRQSASNAIWNTCDYIILPALLLLLTPFFVARLGVQQFGIWVLTNAIAGLSGIFGFGLGEATIKYVSAYRAREDWRGVGRVIGATLTVYGALGLLTGGMIAVCSPLLASRVFRVDPAYIPLAIQALRIAGICFAMRAIQYVTLSAIQGCQRYDLSARISIATKAIVMLGSVVLLLWHRGVCEILWMSAGVTIISGVAMGYAVRQLVPGLRLQPAFGRGALYEVFSFGVYTWLQNIAGTIFAQADIFLVGAMLGTEAVTLYSICQRVAMQIHALPAAGAAFLFPLSSAAAENGDLSRLNRVIARGLQLVAIGAAALGATVFVFARSILTVWMGAEFAVSATNLLRVLAFGYALLAISVVPYNLMNGSGYVRQNTLLAWMSVAVVVAGTIMLIPHFGLMGVGWAKIGNLAPLLVSMWFVQHRLLRSRGWNHILLPFVPILLSFCFGLLVLSAFFDPGLSGAFRLATLGLSSFVVFLGFSLGIQRLFGLCFAR